MEKHNFLQLTESQITYRIRTKAKQQQLIPTKSRRDGKWYFADFNNLLVSYTNGLTDWEANLFLERK